MPQPWIGLLKGLTIQVILHRYYVSQTGSKCGIKDKFKFTGKMHISNMTHFLDEKGNIAGVPGCHPG